MILLPARERNIRGEKFDFGMGKGKSTDVFLYLGDEPEKYIKNRLKSEKGRIYS